MTVPGGKGPDAGGGSAGGSSSAGGTATPTVEELQARLDASEKDRASLAESVRGLTPFKEEAEAGRKRIAELEGGGPGGGAGGGSPYDDDGEKVYVTRAQAVQIGNETADARIKAYVEAQNKIQVEEAKKQIAFATDRKKWLAQAEKEYPDTKDPNSELTRTAQQIFEDPANGLSTKTTNALGVEVIRPTHPSAEYDAVARAHKRLADRGSAAGDAKTGAEFASAGGSGGGGQPPGAGKRKLTDQEFLRLPPEERAKYQQEQFDQGPT